MPLDLQRMRPRNAGQRRSEVRTVAVLDLAMVDPSWELAVNGRSDSAPLRRWRFAAKSPDRKGEKDTRGQLTAPERKYPK